MIVRLTRQILPLILTSIFGLVFLIFPSTLISQSVEQQFPTPVFANHLQGEIIPRDIGDARQTTYYYTFNGRQGDLFINIVTVNLNADIDMFVENGLRPLTKIVVYADRGETETGRVLYLRKPEKLLLRIQGRTPNDDPGRFQFKFAGGFVSAAAGSEQPPELPRVNDAVEAPVRVNSSGEIISRAVEVAKVEKTERPTVDKVETDDSSATRTESRRPTTILPKARPKTDPMAGFNLVVEFRDGTKLERSMIDVGRFQVDRGTLTINNKNGSVSRYSMADVVRVSIE